MTSTSEGPAGMSMDTIASEFWSVIFAAVTNWFPGPKILSTLGQVSVPWPIAATAWAPPAWRMCVTPAFLATYSTSGTTDPSFCGGVARTTFLHPAIMAGTASMSAVDGSTAVPPGTYRPTAPMGRLTRLHLTPGMVSTSTSATSFCASWNFLMFANATSKASRTSSSRTGSGRSATFTTTASRSTPSNLDVYSLTAASPLVATASTMGATVPRMEVKSTLGRLRISTRSSASRLS
mmetsp:Transcript_2058/g.9325  ORF Transcript_2058/g.9325 Transcript_2058/m.9325 type:complete len:236 (-) Transcript_2058:328-1035(-)